MLCVDITSPHDYPPKAKSKFDLLQRFNEATEETKTETIQGSIAAQINIMFPVIVCIAAHRAIP